MPVRKKASAAKTRAKRSTVAKPKTARSPKARAKASPKARAKTSPKPRAKPATRKLAKPTVRAKSTAKPKITAKSTAKVGRVARPVRKPPIARKDAPKPRTPRPMLEAKRPKLVEPSEPTSEMDVTLPEDDAPVTEKPAFFEMSREPIRGGLHDGANHSKPEVQLHKQLTRTMRTPERRHTIRGH